MAKKRKLREWEIPMDFSKRERKEYRLTVEDQLNSVAVRKLLII